MQWQILLTQPRVQRTLRLTLVFVSSFFALWTLAALFFFFGGGRAIAEERQKLTSLRGQINEVTGALAQKKQRAAQAKTLQIAAPLTSGGLQFADALSREGEAAGAEKLNLRFKAPIPATSSPLPASSSGSAEAKPAANGAAGGQNSGGQNGNTAANGGTLTSDGWGQAPFECEVTGRFETLVKTLERISKLPFVFDLSKADLQRSRIEGDGSVVLQMRVSGVLYGLAETK